MEHKLVIVIFVTNITNKHEFKISFADLFVQIGAISRQNLSADRQASEQVRAVAVYKNFAKQDNIKFF